MSDIVFNCVMVAVSRCFYSDGTAYCVFTYIRSHGYVPVNNQYWYTYMKLIANEQKLLSMGGMTEWVSSEFESLQMLQLVSLSKELYPYNCITDLSRNEF